MSSVRVLLSGPPGIGKTTVVKSVWQNLQQQEVPAHGFYTEEVRVNGQRTGFDLVTLDGKRNALARIGQKQGHAHVGRYAVFTEALEDLVLPMLKSQDCRGTILVLDEIGKMELHSRKFATYVKELFELHDAPVLATVPAADRQPPALVQELYKHPKATTLTVTRNNRDAMPAKILSMLREK